MTAVDILPCFVEEGNNVRRPYPGEPTQFYGAYQKDSEGLHQHIVDFYCTDAGPEYQNDRYSAVFFISGSSGEIQRDNLNAVQTGIQPDIERIVQYESLPESARLKIISQCLGYVE